MWPLLIAVFLLSNRMAETTVVGFPNFQDSEFALLDQNGETRRPSDFAGKPIALFFGFTYCPDICPTTLMTLTAIQDQLAAEGKAADHLQILFVTVDPERDTPAQLNAYLSLFDTSVTGLTGTRTDIESALRHFGVYAEKPVMAMSIFMTTAPRSICTGKMAGLKAPLCIMNHLNIWSKK